jgi:hypothetical protein
MIAIIRSRPPDLGDQAERGLEHHTAQEHDDNAIAIAP